MSDIIERTYRHRRETGVKRNDIIDVCIEEMDKSEHREEFKDDMEAILVANALMLFFAGFDTIGLTISMLFHYLMKDHECQDKIAEEITEALNATNGEITYDMVETLKYTDMALREAMRYFVMKSQFIELINYLQTQTSVHVSRERVYQDIQDTRHGVHHPKGQHCPRLLPQVHAQPGELCQPEQL